MLLEEDYDRIWKAYLGFLDLAIEEFMEIQERLLLEQIDLLSKCKLGKKILGKKSIKSMAEFRKYVPLTTYDDYADTLLNKRSEDLPSEPLHWVQTTWKGGKKPIKLAPYSKTMVEEHTKMFLSSLILSTSKKRGHFNLRNYDRFLYGMAPLPYLTGFAPYILKHEIDFEYLPSTERAEKLSFRERNKVGFNLAVTKGADLFFGLASVLVKIGEGFASDSNSGKIGMPSNLKQAIKMIKAGYKKRIKKERLLPKDLFEFKGIVCGGTDSDTYKSQIEYYFGITPLEIFGGTESAAVATETWSRNGLTFFPDVNFLEFIPEYEMKKEEKNEKYQPKTVLFNEIESGETYELVITKLRGGAFVRYRIGDVVKCVGLENIEDKIRLPQVKYIDRVSNIIDLSGFTRITKQIIGDAIKLSGLEIPSWTACKEYGESRPYINLYIEDSLGETIENIREKINIQMKLLDSDYNDVHALLGHEPLKLTLLSDGTFDKYKELFNNGISRINPSREELSKLITCSEGV
ncbi:MAG: GH3 auxin-responsive promoter family protein [Candidatus Izimaplasma sp.]|nr:GH3 auxin-responsive promoter family protein [Candidatus Izimaplasma bacterium]